MEARASVIIKDRGIVSALTMIKSVLHLLHTPTMYTNVTHEVLAEVLSEGRSGENARRKTAVRASLCGVCVCGSIEQ